MEFVYVWDGEGPVDEDGAEGHEEQAEPAEEEPFGDDVSVV